MARYSKISVRRGCRGDSAEPEHPSNLWSSYSPVSWSTPVCKEARGPQLTVPCTKPQPCNTKMHRVETGAPVVLLQWIVVDSNTRGWGWQKWAIPPRRGQHYSQKCDTRAMLTRDPFGFNVFWWENFYGGLPPSGTDFYEEGTPVSPREKRHSTVLLSTKPGGDHGGDTNFP